MAERGLNYSEPPCPAFEYYVGLGRSGLVVDDPRMPARRRTWPVPAALDNVTCDRRGPLLILHPRIHVAALPTL